MLKTLYMVTVVGAVGTVAVALFTPLGERFAVRGGNLIGTFEAAFIEARTDAAATLHVAERG